jgi:hypothetical protein
MGRRLLQEVVEATRQKPNLEWVHAVALRDRVLASSRTADSNLAALLESCAAMTEGQILRLPVELGRHPCSYLQSDGGTEVTLALRSWQNRAQSCRMIEERCSPGH